MEVYLREVTPADKDEAIALSFIWRNRPEVYRGFYSQKKVLGWHDHIIWWAKRNSDWHSFFIVASIEGCREKVGILNIGQCDSWTPEIGYLVGEVTLWGKGIATEAVKKACEWLEGHGYQYCHTTVKENNTASRRVLEKNGFYYACEAREGEERWEKKL